MTYDGAINNSMSIAAPTSFGKTVILSFIEKELLLSKAERVLIVTSKINNNASMFKMMRRILPENIHIYQFDSSSKDKQRVIEMGDVPKPCIICCCYASLSHLPTTLIFNRLHVDEADEYRTLLNTIKRMLDGKKYQCWNSSSDKPMSPTSYLPHCSRTCLKLITLIKST